MITSLPNLLTLSRIFAIPALIAAFYLDSFMGNWIAFGIFAVAGITDFFDGYLARIRNEQSVLGQFLDPVADKLLVAAVLMLLVAFQRVTDVSILAAIVILCREIMVSGLREFLSEIRVGMPVSKLAKWKTTVQILAMGFLLTGDAGDILLPIGWTQIIGITLLWIAAGLTIYTGYDYLRLGLKHMTEEPVINTGLPNTDLNDDES
ncbi:MAG: CDP-diacylglycerol--glycerol-3-phosphate 3-phosphatidyltransferase [Alphaproteobacteria bacterium]|jgi:cardiolipin synthase (CMP-forming)|nr:CDP-diacylglycerol--glycerol-3-phosphate 3-phosphatidyltransferase [Alphaproteobacteria bacterium]MBT4016308.1 CDP-diacylglycerol--glycerol-3-phosphate 3-phosphatidyltransferase [Alphaproteobacteria bacterium]MBT4964872.1 CDP-diacylglycerol--glycerol-3-phosphate 3-phosphatidyltransferase [Alphaproteobacteria bacterium]MBT5161636.1 CDP-diacylglycerol--glycerol-3-phosphate 3-phosphatidyltransferase [Alphaproteobacteria bacterium]MBT5919090.1 CDP-diacylglycerol--glycerol-3-phosphate 3-phosphati